MEVNGYHSPEAAGGLDYSTNGSLVLPGMYSVVLKYGSEQTRQSFSVALDPRLHPTDADLAERLALTRRIEADMNALNRDLNRALAAREKLQKAVSSHGLAQRRAAPTEDALSESIDRVVQMKIRSSEGDSMQESKLHACLAYLVADIEIAYARPMEAQYAVFRDLDQQEKAGEQALDAAVAKADHLINVNVKSP